MIFDDTLLSAHLDDELDGETRLAVDTALAADPALAEQLRLLAQTRSAVATLERPAMPTDLSGAVLGRITLERVSARRRPYYWIATAASLLFALFLWSQEFDNGQRHRGPEVVQTSALPAPAVPSVAQPIEVAFVPVAPAPPADLVAQFDMKALPNDPNEPAREQLLEMLDRPGVRRIMIFVDSIDPSARSRVKEALKDVSRKNPEFGSLSVAQGIVIDPVFPDAAEVFATVMDGRERKALLSKLKGKGFGTVVDNPQVVSHLGLQLVENDSIQFDAGPRAAGLRDDPQKQVLAALVHRADGRVPEGDPIKRFAAGPLVQNNPVVGPPDLEWQADAARSVPVIVWLTTRSRH